MADLKQFTKREAAKEIFDYSAITDSQKTAITEVYEILKDEGQDKMAEIIKHKFQLAPAIKVPPESSVFVQLVMEFGLKSRLQGWNLGETTDTGKETHYPIMDLQEDIRDLDRFMLWLKDKYSNASK